MKRKPLYILIVAMFLLSACGGGNNTAVATTAANQTVAPTAAVESTVPATGAATSASQDATLHIGWDAKPDTLNPAYAFLTPSYTIFHLVYSTLTVQASDGKYVGLLAKDWSVSADGLTWTYHLKTGVKWHNGKPFTADQIAWAFSAIMKDPEGWATLANYTNGFKEVTAPDASTVVIVTEYPIANMDYRTSFLYAFYPPDFETFTNATDLQNFANNNPMGTGGVHAQVL